MDSYEKDNKLASVRIYMERIANVTAENQETIAGIQAKIDSEMIEIFKADKELNQAIKALENGVDDYSWNSYGEIEAWVRYCPDPAYQGDEIICTLWWSCITFK